MSPLKTIDKQTLKLVDYLIEMHKETQTNLDLVTDYAFGVKYYPYNKYIITHMRGKDVEGGKEKSAPHLLIINLGEAFNLDFNYFYDESIEVKNAFLSEQRKSYHPNAKFVEDVFQEIDHRFERFTNENRLLNSAEERAHYKKTENELYTIKVQLNELLSSDTILNKRSEIIELFDSMIALSKTQIETTITKIHLEQDIAKLKDSAISNSAEKIAALEQNLQSLTKELADCNKMAFEAQKGQTEALKELLALKDKL